MSRPTETRRLICSYLFLLLSKMIKNSEADTPMRDASAPMVTLPFQYLADFRCRFFVVDGIWIPLAESMVIDRFKPVWNCLFDGFGNHAPGRGRSSMMTPSWDWFYPGRSWAVNLQPFTKSKEQLDSETREYLSNMLN